MQGSKSIYWHDGLFLRPQHLQQQELHLKSYALDLQRINSPYLWGIKSINIVQSALNNQILEIDQCEVIFQDGTHVKCAETAKISRRNISGHWDTSGKPMSVYLGLRKIQAGRNNIDMLWDGLDSGPLENHELSATRYQVPETPTFTYDLFSDDKKDEVFYLEHKLQLFINAEASEAVDFHLIKITELYRLGTEVKISEQFIAAALSINSSPVLAGLLRELNEHTVSSARELALYKLDKGLNNINFGSRDMVYFLALLTLNRHAPYFHQMLEEEVTFPWQTYAVLCQLAGELSTFTGNYNAFGGQGNNNSNAIPTYDHTNLMSCFSQVVKKIIRMMDELIEGPDYSTELFFDGTYYYSDLNGCEFQGKNEYFLRVHSDSVPEDSMLKSEELDRMTDYVQSMAKISSKEYLPILIAHSLPGVTIQYDVSPPTQLPRNANSVYFRIDHHNVEWNAIRESLNAAVYFEKPVEGIKIELMMING